MTIEQDLIRHAVDKAARDIAEVASLGDARLIVLTASTNVFIGALVACFGELPRDKRSAIMNETFKAVFKQVHERSAKIAID